MLSPVSLRRVSGESPMKLLVQRIGAAGTTEVAVVYLRQDTTPRTARYASAKPFFWLCEAILLPFQSC